jgi:hypothetical protein
MLVVFFDPEDGGSTVNFHQTTWCNIPEDAILLIDLCLRIQALADFTT